MGTIAERGRSLLEGILPASRGVGPLLQRDYWAVVADCRRRPSEVVRLVAARFWDFSPPDVAAFRRVDGTGQPLRVGDEMEVRIRMAGTFRVRVIHRDATSLTISTIIGHPEAGRITFGAYRNDYADVVFHIRSRARSGSPLFFLGFLALGEPMQTNTWADFVNRVAVTVGTGVVGFIHVETRRTRGTAEDVEPVRSPTFIAEAD